MKQRSDGSLWKLKEWESFYLIFIFKGQICAGVGAIGTFTHYLMVPFFDDRASCLCTDDNQTGFLRDFYHLITYSRKEERSIRQ